MVLASASPRRAELLRRMGFDFEVIPSNLPEDYLEGETPTAHAERLSVEKAKSVSASRPDSIVVAGDTVVVLGERVLGKPRDEDEAVTTLMGLSGRTHSVVSGLALAFPRGGVRSGVLTTEVTFRAFSEAFARKYVETGEPMDKAGAYGIQGLGGALVDRIHGDYHTVVGLPLPLFLDLLQDGGWRYHFGELVPATPA
jgi:septum formation protein